MERLLGLWLLWVMFLLCEVVWLGFTINRGSSTNDLFFILTIILTTIAIGSTGLFLFKNQLVNSKKS